MDLLDFSHLQACLTGAGIEQTQPACLNARLDYDGTMNGDKDVDGDDMAILVGCISGSGVYAMPSCDPD